MTFDPVHTARLRIEPLAPRHAESLERLIADWNVARFTANIPHPYPTGGMAAFIDAVRAAMEGPRPNWRGAVIFEGEPVGSVGLRRGEDAHVLGYWLGRPFWGRGIGKEAARAFSDAALIRGLTTRLTASTMPTNGASRAVLIHASFVETGRGVIATPMRDVTEREAVLFERRG